MRPCCAVLCCSVDLTYTAFIVAISMAFDSPTRWTWMTTLDTIFSERGTRG